MDAHLTGLEGRFFLSKDALSKGHSSFSALGYSEAHCKLQHLMPGRLLYVAHSASVVRGAVCILIGRSVIYIVVAECFVLRVNRMHWSC